MYDGSDTPWILGASSEAIWVCVVVAILQSNLRLQRGDSRKIDRVMDALADIPLTVVVKEV